MVGKNPVSKSLNFKMEKRQRVVAYQKNDLEG